MISWSGIVVAFVGRVHARVDADLEGEEQGVQANIEATLVNKKRPDNELSVRIPARKNNHKGNFS